MSLNTQLRIADNLRYLRNVFDYTQEQVADHLHMCRSTYSLFELGKKSLNADVIISLSDLYHIRIDTILQIDRQEFINDMILFQQNKQQVLDLIEMYDKLSIASKGRLLERAEMLLESETNKDTPDSEPMA